MSISKFPGHMRSAKLTFSATVLTLGLKDFVKRKICGNCARAPRLTAVCSIRALQSRSFAYRWSK